MQFPPFVVMRQCSSPPFRKGGLGGISAGTSEFDAKHHFNKHHKSNSRLTDPEIREYRRLSQFRRLRVSLPKSPSIPLYKRGKSNRATYSFAAIASGHRI